MRREKDDIDRILQEILTRVTEAAKKDKEITPVETKIIKTVEQSLQSMQQQLYDILNSDLPDHEFNEIANEIIHNEIEHAIKLAEESELTQKESEVIKCLREIINEGL